MEKDQVVDNTMDNITVVAKGLTLEEAKHLVSNTTALKYKFREPFNKINCSYYFGIVPMNVSVGDKLTFRHKNKLIKKKVEAIWLDGSCEFLVGKN